MIRGGAASTFVSIENVGAIAASKGERVFSGFVDAVDLSIQPGIREAQRLMSGRTEGMDASDILRMSAEYGGPTNAREFSATRDSVTAQSDILSNAQKGNDEKGNTFTSGNELNSQEVAQVAELQVELGEHVRFMNNMEVARLASSQFPRFDSDTQQLQGLIEYVGVDTVLAELRRTNPKTTITASSIDYGANIGVLSATLKDMRKGAFIHIAGTPTGSIIMEQNKGLSVGEMEMVWEGVVTDPRFRGEMYRQYRDMKDVQMVTGDATKRAESLARLSQSSRDVEQTGLLNYLNEDIEAWREARYVELQQKKDEGFESVLSRWYGVDRTTRTFTTNREGISQDMVTLIYDGKEKGVQKIIAQQLFADSGVDFASSDWIAELNKKDPNAFATVNALAQKHGNSMRAQLFRAYSEARGGILDGMFGFLVGGKNAGKLAFSDREYEQMGLVFGDVGREIVKGNPRAAKLLDKIESGSIKVNSKQKLLLLMVLGLAAGGLGAGALSMIGMGGFAGLEGIFPLLLGAKFAGGGTAAGAGIYGARRAGQGLGALIDRGSMESEVPGTSNYTPVSSSTP